MSLRILGCILAVLIGAQSYPQRQRESPDFNHSIKPGEKTLRSLDQISLEDGSTLQGRSSYTDSYGNPVKYDSLSDVDAQKPSNNKDTPHQYVIPGYASGILQPHEVPSRSDVQARGVNDDRIHFVDPLNKDSFQTFNNAPSTSLTLPGINDGDSQQPIHIPRPNIDLDETPISPVENPSFNPLQSPPLNTNFQNSPPSIVLELPVDQNSNTQPFLTGLIPPHIPSSDGVEIPRPNLDAHETPIDDSQNVLNQGLLPPTTVPSAFNTFSNPDGEGPVIITDTVFAPKPVNGLLPPKDPLPNSFDFQTGPSINNNLNALPTVSSSNKFTGTIPTNIPVQVIHDEPKGVKYTGTFGGAPGILVSNNPSDRVVPTQITAAQPTVAFTPQTTNSVTPTVASGNKFTGTFGGAAGLLSPNGNGPINTVPALQTTLSTPSTQPNTLFTSTNKKVLNFGGPPGILRPFDVQKN